MTHETFIVLSPTSVFYFMSDLGPILPESEMFTFSDPSVDTLPADGNTQSVDESTMPQTDATTCRLAGNDEQAITVPLEVANEHVGLEEALDTARDAGLSSQIPSAPARLIVGDARSVETSAGGEQIVTGDEESRARQADIDDAATDPIGNTGPTTVGFESANYLRASYGKISRKGRRFSILPKKSHEDSEEFCVLFEIKGDHVVRQYVDVDYDGVIDYSRTIYNDCHEVWRDIQEFSPKPGAGSNQYRRQHPRQMAYPQPPAAPPVLP